MREARRLLRSSRNHALWRVVIHRADGIGIIAAVACQCRDCSFSGAASTSLGIRIKPRLNSDLDCALPWAAGAVRRAER